MRRTDRVCRLTQRGILRRQTCTSIRGGGPVCQPPARSRHLVRTGMRSEGEHVPALLGGGQMKPCHLFVLIVTLLLGVTETSAAQTTMEPWLTRSADNSRSGWNPRERQLTQASVATKGISRATIIPVIGDARGMEAQPLILPYVKTSLGTRDVMVLPSMANVVRGVDAHDGSGIWQVTLGMPITGSANIDSHSINDHWGCLSTGVIDPDTQRLYQVCWVSPDKTGKPQTARYFMFVLNAADGSQVVPPVQIEG